MKRLVVVSFVFLIPSHSFGGAWLQPANGVYSKLSYAYFESDQIFAPKGNKKIDGPDYKDQSFFLYTERGVNEKWNAILSLAAKKASTNVTGSRESEFGLQDLWVHVKRGLSERKFATALQFGVKIPLGYDREATPPLGDGQIDFEIRGLLGRSLYPFPGYANVEYGFRKRNGDVSDEFVYLAEAGVQPTQKYLIKIYLDGVDSRSNDAASKTGGRAANVFDEEYTNLGGAFSWFLNPSTGLEFGYQQVIAGGNTAAGDTYSIGIFKTSAPPERNEP